MKKNKQECIPVGCLPPAHWPWGGCTCLGVCTCPEGGTWPRVYLPRGCTYPGGTCPGTPPYGQNSWHMLLKLLPCQNFVAGGKNNNNNWETWPGIEPIHSNHYTRTFSVLLWGCNWILIMHGWFCPICLFHLIGRKSLHLEKKVNCFHGEGTM